MNTLEHTSVPAWARGSDAATGDTAAVGVADLGAGSPVGGAWHLLVGVGDDGRARVAAWERETGLPTETVLAGTVDEAGPRLSDALARATVGVRLRIAGPVGDCLQLRGVALTAGIEDDELDVNPTGTGPIELYCGHCAAVTRVEAGIGDVADCAGCARGLHIYYHVSRNSGRFLGFQHDAETRPGNEEGTQR
ncbi:hypothetical protein BJF85_10495 [Saccharomonospora sp. CUA-673]|uniref:dimethylamine monooxygenase subunit DmmA family protein n=1 Tax=Saccharomonospora sp. CUA-673 TaxID=1904969 RepID=UPI0009699FE5|nr:dimethylamine monooxygenase subunit DmmA family protein [Saccharomonospora sp. CUA-673]OLT49260.1 hypothetical protein BJF85_10495 [Saccharomonospora sp. CUA-673]